MARTRTGRSRPGWTRCAGRAARNLLWGGIAGAAGATAASQVVDVGRIDGGDRRRPGDRAAVGRAGGALAVTDSMTATASFLGAGGADLGGLSVGTVTAEERRSQATLLRRVASAPVPAGTRQVRVGAAR